MARDVGHSTGLRPLEDDVTGGLDFLANPLYKGLASGHRVAGPAGLWTGFLPARIHERPACVEKSLMWVERLQGQGLAKAFSLRKSGCAGEKVLVMDVGGHPAPATVLGRICRGADPAEWIGHQVAWFGEEIHQ